MHVKRWRRWVLAAPFLALLAPAGVQAGEPPSTYGTPLAAPAAHCCDPGGYEKTCEFIVRGGPVTPLGKGFLENRLETGWGIQVGIQQELCCPHPWFPLFGELAAFYATNDGDDVFRATSGTVFAEASVDAVEVDGEEIILGATVTHLDDFLNTRMNNLQRIGIQFAIGGRTHALVTSGWNFAAGGIQCSWRAGVRTGAARLQYDQHQSAALEEFLFVSNRETRDPSRLRLVSDVDEPELFLGVFAAVGVHVTCFNPVGLPWTVKIGAELEAGVDYLNTGDYSPDDQGLATWSPMLSFSISR